MNLAEMMAYQDTQKGRGAPAASGGLADVILGQFQQDMDKNRRYNNVKEQISQFQKLTQELNSMPDNSDIGKSNDLIGNELKQRNSNVINSSTMIPTREITLGNDGINMKFGFKSASPNDQKSLIDVQKSQSDMQRDNQKRSFISGYISGQIPEGAFLQEVGNLGLTPDEFESATSARNRLQSIQPQTGTSIPLRNTQLQVPEGMTIEKMDKFGNPVLRPLSISEKKAKSEIDSANEANIKKAETAKKNAMMALNTVKELKNNINEFGFTGPIWSTPGTQKRVWAKNFDVLKDMLTLDKLKELKESSSTGASGLGQLSDAEGLRLQNASFKLDKGLPKEKALEYLNDIESSMSKVLGDNVSRETMSNDPLGIR